MSTGVTATATATAETATSTSNVEKLQAELNCSTCLATFDTKEIKRAHMREDWHVYNLKRRIASLAPISRTVFEKQVLAVISGNDEDTEFSSFQRSCTACGQHYTSPKAWQSHLKSRKHTPMTIDTDLTASSMCIESNESSLSNASSDEHEEDQSISKEETFSPLRCLFCNFESSSLESNMTHMSNAHSFFIPDMEYLMDLESLLSYFSVVISVFHECLFCGCSKTNKFAVQDHMRGKGHCKVDFEDEEHDLKQFYDFSGDLEHEEEQSETEQTLFPNEYELRLPSGKTLGHRSRSRPHQDLHSRPSASRQQLLTEEATPPDVENEPDSALVDITDRRLALRAGTSTSLMGIPLLQRRALIAIEKKMEMMETRAKTKYQHVLEKGGNKQKRYKVASMGKKQGGLEKRLG